MMTIEELCEKFDNDIPDFVGMMRKEGSCREEVKEYKQLYPKEKVVYE